MKPLSATEIRDRLRARGYDLSKHDTPLASIHSVLRRIRAPKRYLTGLAAAVRQVLRESGETLPEDAPR